MASSHRITPCFRWQYGKCNKTLATHVESHKCNCCQKKGKQHFGSGEERCKGCYRKTCCKTVFLSLVAAVFLFINIFMDFYTGFFYLKAGHKGFGSATLGWCALSWLISIIRSFHHGRHLLLKRSKKLEAQKPGGKRIFMLKILFPFQLVFMSLFGPIVHQLNIIYYTIQCRMGLHELEGAAIKTRSPIIFINDIPQIFIQLYICFKINAFTVMHLVTISTSLISVGTEMTAVILYNRKKCLEKFGGNVHHMTLSIEPKSRGEVADEAMMKTTWLSSLWKRSVFLRTMINSMLIVSLYPLSILLGVTVIHQPWNWLAMGMAIIMSMGLNFTAVQSWLFFVMEVFIVRETPTKLSKFVLKKLLSFYNMIKNNKNRFLFINTAYHFVVFVFAESLLCYWFFYRSINFLGLDYEEQLKRVEEEFNENFSMFNFTKDEKSCSQMWIDTKNKSSLTRLKGMFQDCRVFASVTTYDRFNLFIMVTFLNCIFGIAWNLHIYDRIMGVGASIELVENKLNNIRGQYGTIRRKLDLILSFPTKVSQDIFPPRGCCCQSQRTLKRHFSRLLKPLCDEVGLNYKIDQVVTEESHVKKWMAQRLKDDDKLEKVIIRFKDPKAQTSVWSKKGKVKDLGFEGMKLHTIMKPTGNDEVRKNKKEKGKKAKSKDTTLQEEDMV